MQIEQAGKHAADLHWLAFLLTGRRETSIDIAVDTIAAEDVPSRPYFSTWMVAWARRVVIAKALGQIRGELAASARRTESKRVNKAVVPSRDWALDPGTTKAEIEQALLAIDLFPRAALLLSVFEGVPIADATVLLDTDPDLVRKARAAGLLELTANLARIQSWRSTAAKPHLAQSEAQHV
jgi:DNA-directed RNA polymerase specialized sigma24 family protein